MIRKKMNLVCKEGHRHFAPNPKYWVGRDCGHGTCKLPLRLIETKKKAVKAK